MTADRPRKLYRSSGKKNIEAIGPGKISESLYDYDPNEIALDRINIMYLRVIFIGTNWQRRRKS
jgi:hypothetical protein